MQMSGYGGKREKLKWREWVKSKEACQNDRQTVNMKIERRRCNGNDEWMSVKRTCNTLSETYKYTHPWGSYPHTLTHFHRVDWKQIGRPKKEYLYSAEHTVIRIISYIIVSTKVLSSKTVNIDNNNNCFLSTKSAYQFLKTLKAGVMAAENSALPSQE